MGALQIVVFQNYAMDSRLRGNDGGSLTVIPAKARMTGAISPSFPRRRESIVKLYNTSILHYTRHELEKRQIEMHHS